MGRNFLIYEGKSLISLNLNVKLRLRDLLHVKFCPFEKFHQPDFEDFKLNKVMVYETLLPNNLLFYTEYIVHIDNVLINIISSFSY